MAYTVFPDASKKSETFSLSFQPLSAIESHAEVHLGEKTNAPRALEEFADRAKRNKGAEGEDVNAPLCPLLPFVKRNINNKLAMHLEDSRLDRKIVQ